MPLQKSDVSKMTSTMTLTMTAKKARTARTPSRRTTTTSRPATMAPLGLAGMEVCVANTFWSRFKGLMLSRPRHVRPQALLLSNCSSVHTCFMRYALDIVYLSRQGQVTKLVKGLKPWRLSLGARGTRHTLELPAGSIDMLGLQLGQQLQHPALTGVIQK
jgi:uncharacterized protein